MKRCRLCSPVILLALCVGALPADAQTSSSSSQTIDAANGDPQLAFDKGRTDVAILVGAANTVPRFHLKGDHDFTAGMVEWGRVVTRRRGTPPVDGHLEILVEILPFFAMSESPPAYGFGAMPVFLRWTFEQPKPVRPFLEVAGGVLGTNQDVPERTTRFNFMAYGGGGLRVRVSERHALLVGYRWHHISNGNRVKPNPGINSHMLYLGVSILR